MQKNWCWNLLSRWDFLVPTIDVVVTQPLKRLDDLFCPHRNSLQGHGLLFGSEWTTQHHHNAALHSTQLKLLQVSHIEGISVPAKGVPALDLLVAAGAKNPALTINSHPAHYGKLNFIETSQFLGCISDQVTVGNGIDGWLCLAPSNLVVASHIQCMLALLADQNGVFHMVDLGAG